MRIIFAGTPNFAVPCLEALLQSEHEVLAVYTQPDRPAGRGRQVTASAVKQCAQQHGIPVRQMTKFSDEDCQQLEAEKPDAWVVVAYGLLLTQQLLDIPKQGVLNVHASLLPRWRGAAPIQYSLLSGDTKTGITIMQMVRALDAGDILAQSVLPIKSDATAVDLHDALSKMGAQLLMDTLARLAEAQASAQPQCAARVTYAPKIKKTDACINWNQAAKNIALQIRAFYGWPVAYTYGGAHRLRIGQATWQDAASVGVSLKGAPGTVVAINNQGIAVATQEGVVWVQVLQIAGGKFLQHDVFLRAHHAWLCVGLVLTPEH